MTNKNLKEQLLYYYNLRNKHAQYQNFPHFVTEALNVNSNIDEGWRGDTARYLFLQEQIDFSKLLSVGDIAANTGRFALDFAYSNPNTQFTAIEINPDHTKFIKIVKDAFDLGNMKVKNLSAEYDNLKNIGNYDLVLLMNLLHHAGQDFDKKYVKDVNQLKNYIIRYLVRMKDVAQKQVFQLGYNWCGNKQTPIISSESPIQMLSYVKEICDRSGWHIHTIALYDPERKQYRVISKPESFMQSDKFMLNSEFYKRPLYILNQ